MIDIQNPSGKIIITFLLVLLLALSVTAETDVQMLTEYFDLLVSGNIESAQYLWTEACQERSSRFNIKYDNIPLKGDCSSPIVQNINLMRDYLYPPVKKVTKLAPGNYSQLEYSSVIDGELVKHYYYTYKDGNYHWLIYPQDYYGKDWLVKETRFFRIKYHPEMEGFLNPVVLDEADHFIESIADSLGLKKSDLELFENKKIEYFYCDSDSTVKKITGFLVKGTLDLQSNDIISSFFPHYHEITHFLVNYRLRSLPLFTLPLMREGIAVYYGGRWGKTPSSLMALGGFLYREDIVGIDSILTVYNFDNNAASDIAYPVAGLFTAYLMSQMSQDTYFKLYRKLSGDNQTVTQLTDSTIKDIINKELGASSWDNLIGDFDNFIEKRLKERANILPGQLKKGKEILSTENFSILNKKDWVAVEYKSLNDEPPTGNILFGYDSKLKGIKSLLFESQYKQDTPYEGYRYGIRFDKFEAGLYDYATNHLLAKYIWGITPSDEYYIEEEKEIFIMFKKDIVGSLMPVEADYKLLPN